MKVLCRLADLAERGAKGLTLTDGVDREVFVVRADGQVHGYVNSCPHIGTPLEVLPDRFLTRDGREILCSTHGARFEIATGLCVAGPCRGRSLRRLQVQVVDGLIVLAESE